MFNVECYTNTAAKVELKKRGHSYRSAAEHIGRSYQWICQVLNGRKKSQPVIRAVFNLPIRTSTTGKPSRNTSKQRGIQGQRVRESV